MDDQPEPEKEQSKINKIDLTALQGFSFGTQWTPAEKASTPRREGREREHQGSRERSGGGHPPRDRRPTRRPAGEGPQAGSPPRGRQDEQRGGGEQRERFQNVRDRGNRGPSQQQDNRPYLSPYHEVIFYPEDEIFEKIVTRVRDSKHTFELFEIARAILGKSERSVIVVRRKPDTAGNQPPVFVSAVDGMPFESEEAAIGHVVRNLMSHFFTVEEVELEAPKGSFVVVSRCSITGELLGPPNYHRYQHILQQHHAARLPQMAFDRFRERIESVREPEVIGAWLEKMKKGVRYTWKTPAEGTEAPVFEAPEDARTYLLANARDQIVRQLEHARFHGKLLETMADSEIRHAIEGQLERQRRFPLDTANALRGRLRREGFTIFKKGSKGVSYVCAVKRKFRAPGQMFSDSIGNLIKFIEEHPLIFIRDLPAKMLGIMMPAPASAGAEAAEVKALSPEEETLARKMHSDLRWLVSEGYVTEYSDGKLFAPPESSPQSRKEEDLDDDDASEDSQDDSHDAHPERAADVAPAKEISEAPSEPAQTEAEPAAQTEAVAEATPSEPEATAQPAADEPKPEPKQGE